MRQHYTPRRPTRAWEIALFAVAFAGNVLLLYWSL